MLGTIAEIILGVFFWLLILFIYCQFYPKKLENILREIASLEEHEKFKQTNE